MSWLDINRFSDFEGEIAVPFFGDFRFHIFVRIRPDQLDADDGPDDVEVVDGGPNGFVTLDFFADGEVMGANVSGRFTPSRIREVRCVPWLMNGSSSSCHHPRWQE